MTANYEITCRSRSFLGRQLRVISSCVYLPLLCSYDKTRNISVLILIEGFWEKNKKSMLACMNRKFIKKRTKNIIIKMNSNSRNKIIFYCLWNFFYAFWWYLCTRIRVFNNIMWLNQIVILGQISENCHGSQRVNHSRLIN